MTDHDDVAKSLQARIEELETILKLPRISYKTSPVFEKKSAIEVTPIAERHAQLVDELKRLRD